MNLTLILKLLIIIILITMSIGFFVGNYLFLKMFFLVYPIFKKILQQIKKNTIHLNNFDMIKNLISNYNWNTFKTTLGIILHYIIFFTVSLSPFVFIVVCLIIYLSVGLMFMLSLLSIYLCTYISNSFVYNQLHSWCCGLDFWRCLREAMNGKIIIDDINSKHNTKNKYIFAYHPHGAFPLTLAWFINSPEFRSHYYISENKNNKGFK